MDGWMDEVNNDSSFNRNIWYTFFFLLLVVCFLID